MMYNELNETLKAMFEEFQGKIRRDKEMFSPNDQDDPNMDNELQVGEQVLWNPEVYDGEVVTLRDDLKGKPVTIVKIVHDGPDYIVASETGETFPVRYWMIIRLDGSLVLG
jgi:hypothetical protein